VFARRHVDDALGEAYRPAIDSMPDQSRAPAVYALLLACGMTLGVTAVVLVVGEDGPPVYPPAQRWMVLAGLAVLPMGVWMARHLDARPRKPGQLPRWASAYVLIGVGLAYVGAGLSYGDRHAPWLLLIVPGSVAFLAAAGWTAFSPAADGMPRRPVACAGMLMFSVAGFWLASGALT
jgi:hypothetical protein